MAVTKVNLSEVRAAYEIVLEQWPEDIEPGEKSFHVDGGCNMRTLNEIHDQIENWISTADVPDELEDIIGSLYWSVFQTVHDALKNLNKLHKSEIDFKAVLSRFDGLPEFKVIQNAKN